jgi:hypothetical protein
MIMILSRVRNTIASAAQRAGREPCNSMISHRWRVPGRTMRLEDRRSVSLALIPRGTPFAASLVQYISIASLFDGCWHPRDRHERLRQLIEQLARVLFFAQRHR